MFQTSFLFCMFGLGKSIIRKEFGIRLNFNDEILYEIYTPKTFETNDAKINAKKRRY